MNHMASATKSLGWHGKLPTVGDFVTRGLDTDFVSAWDDWIATGLAALRTRYDGNWLDDYLASPTWRFLLTPGFLPAPLQDQVWAGVLMPSVDRVGRYFPLTITGRLPYLPTDGASQARLWAWLQHIEDAAVDALQDDWSIDALQAELARIGPPFGDLDDFGNVVAQAVGSGIQPPQLQPPQLAAGFFSICGGGEFGGIANSSASGAAKGGCVWYSEVDLFSPRLLHCSSRQDEILSLWKLPSATGIEHPVHPGSDPMAEPPSNPLDNPANNSIDSLLVPPSENLSADAATSIIDKLIAS
jgi:type VI secretion system protein ImpM